MKLLLTGASGLVGAAVARLAARRGAEVVGIVGRFEGELAGLTRRLSLDLADETSVTRAVRDTAPDAIVNCAAVSEPAACEADPVRSAALNVALPETLARLAQEGGATLVHISSEQVFDGASTDAYRVTEPASPINRYGRQKVASECAVLAAAPGLAAVVRAPLLLGDSPSGQRSLHERLLADWAAGRVAKLYVDEFRQPCTAENLAEVLLALVERSELRGLFHWAGAELVSRHELGRRVRERFGLSETAAPISAVTRADTPAVAALRPARLALDLAPLQDALQTRPRTIAEQLASLKLPAALRAWHAKAG